MDVADNAILIVDDEPAVLQVIREYLLEGGYRAMFFAPSALAARNIWHDQKAGIRLLISDLVLPDGRGTLLARDFLYENKECRAILMSGYFVESVDLGGDINDRAVLLQKPFSHTDLLRLVKICLSAGAAQ